MTERLRSAASNACFKLNSFCCHRRAAPDQSAHRVRLRRPSILCLVGASARGRLWEVLSVRVQPQRDPDLGGRHRLHQLCQRGIFRRRYSVLHIFYTGFRVGRFSLTLPLLLRQTSTTPGWLRPFSPTSWSSSGSCPRASCLPTAPEIGRSRTSTTSSRASRLPSKTARTTPSGPSAPARPAPPTLGAAGCVWATSTGTWRRRSAAAGRCASGTQWCGRPIERRR